MKKIKLPNHGSVDDSWDYDGSVAVQLENTKKSSLK